MIVIYGIRERLIPIRAQLSDTIHNCMMSALGLPQDKRAHRFMPMDKEDLYFPGGRTDAYTTIEINLMAGRSKETLKLLIHTLFAEIERNVGLAPIDVEIIIHEQPAHCWGFRGMCGDDAKDLSYRVDV